MNIILLQKVQNLGDFGQQASVKPGYGRNFLIPQGMAAPATKANIEKFEARRAELEKAAKEVFKAAQQRAEKLTGQVITIPAKAGEEGRLFGSLGTTDLSSSISQTAGIKVVKSEVHLPAGPLRQIGEYDILLQLHADVEVTVKILVVAES